MATRDWPLPPPIVSGTPWPPPEIIKRNATYKKRRSIYQCDPEYFRAVLKFPKHWHVVPYAAGKMIARLLTDWMFRVGVKHEFGTDAQGGQTGQETKDAVARIIDQTGLVRTLRKAKRTGSYLADSYLRATVDPLNVMSTDYNVTIDAPAPAMIYPHIDPANCEKSTALSAYWIEDGMYEGKPSKFLAMESFVPGKMILRRYRLGSTNEIVGEPEEEEHETPGSEPMIVHIPNGEADEGWYGSSDVDDIEDLIISSVNVLTRSERANDIALYPKWIVDRSACTFNEETQRYEVNLLEGEALIEDDGNKNTRILNWQGDLTTAENFLKCIRQLMFLLTGISEASLGEGQFGSTGESGTALMLRMILTLFKTEAEKPVYARAISQILYAAQWLEVEQGATYTPAKPRITFPDTMPMDIQRLGPVLIQLRDAGLLSEESAFQMLNPGMDMEQTAAILDKIRAAKAAATPQATATLRDRFRLAVAAA